MDTKQTKQGNKAKEKYVKNKMIFFSVHILVFISYILYLYPALLGIIYDQPLILKKKKNKTKQNTQG